MTYTPDPTKSIEVYVDADFAGGWDPGDAMNADNVYSRTGYVNRGHKRSDDGFFGEGCTRLI